MEEKREKPNFLYYFNELYLKIETRVLDELSNGMVKYLK